MSAELFGIKFGDQNGCRQFSWDFDRKRSNQVSEVSTLQVTDLCVIRPIISKVS